MHVFAASALVLAALAPSAPTVVDPPAEPVTAEVVASIGRGCPVGGFTAPVAPDNRSITLTSVGPGGAMATAGPGTTYQDERKPCHINLRVDVPAGYTYAVGGSEYRGFADLAKGASATLFFYGYFQGMSFFRERTYLFKSPYNDDWVREDRVGIESLVFQPCGTKRSLTLFVELRANKGTADPAATSFLYRDDSETTYALHWKRCPPAHS